VDRLVAFCALVAFAKVQESNRGYTKRVENDTEQLQNKNKNSNLFMNPFRHVGMQTMQDTNVNKRVRGAFKNIR
jgi:hypothetical protein